eukprot:3003302-Pleurochrysis_carterae.AAC.1
MSSVPIDGREPERVLTRTRAVAPSHARSLTSPRPKSPAHACARVHTHVLSQACTHTSAFSGMRRPFLSCFAAAFCALAE